MIIINGKQVMLCYSCHYITSRHIIHITCRGGGGGGLAADSRSKPTCTAHLAYVVIYMRKPVLC